MVLAKRNANGEFVVWNSSSQARVSNNSEPPAEYENDDAHSSKRARISPPNSSQSRYPEPTSFSARPTIAATSRNIPTRPTTPSSHINTTLPAPPGIEIISSGSRLPHATLITPARQTRAATRATAIPPQVHASSSLSRVPSQPSATISSATNFPQPSAFSLTPYPTAGTSSFEVGSSQQSASMIPAKRGRKKTTDAMDSVEKPEKRLAIFKKKCPQNILDRVERVMTQRIFMIDRNRVGELKEEYSVLGSTGNVYSVVVDHKPRCDCPDAMKGNHCKHILFIMLKVLQVNQGSGYWYQKALLTTELEEIFAGAPLAPNSLAHPHIRDAYARVTGKTPNAPTSTPTTPNNKRRIPGPDDDCPVCYDSMHGIAEASLVFCEDCGNGVHKECFVQWQRTAASARKDLTCVWCRARWVLGPTVSGGASASASRGPDGYLNFAGVGGVSPVRDTSTYYHGPRRGSRYHAYQYYDT